MCFRTQLAYLVAYGVMLWLAAFAEARTIIQRPVAATLPAATVHGYVNPSSLGLGDSDSHPVPSGGAFGYGVFTPLAPGFPGAGDTYTDPVFGLAVTRVTDHYPLSTTGNIPYARNGFASADGSLVCSQYGIYHVATGTLAYPWSPASNGSEQSFDPLDPNVYYYPEGSRLMGFDLALGSATTVRDFVSPLGNLGGSVDWIDRSGRYMALNVGGAVRIFDKRNDVLFSGALSGLTGGTGWVGISPDARWLIAAQGNDHRAFPIDLAAGTLGTSGHTFWTLCGDHGDLVSADDGKTYFVTRECMSLSHVYAVDVSLVQSGLTPASRQKQLDENRFLFALTGQDSVHVSGASTVWRNWAFISTEGTTGNNDPSGGWTPYRNEIIMANVLSGEVRRLAHHRSDITGYCTEPRVMAAWDGSGVFFASNFADTSTGGCGYSDLYFIRLR